MIAYGIIWDESSFCRAGQTLFYESGNLFCRLFRFDKSQSFFILQDTHQILQQLNLSMCFLHGQHEDEINGNRFFIIAHDDEINRRSQASHADGRADNMLDICVRDCHTPQNGRQPRRENLFTSDYCIFIT